MIASKTLRNTFSQLNIRPVHGKFHNAVENSFKDPSKWADIPCREWEDSRTLKWSTVAPPALTEARPAWPRNRTVYSLGAHGEGGSHGWGVGGVWRGTEQGRVEGPRRQPQDASRAGPRGRHPGPAAASQRPAEQTRRGHLLFYFILFLFFLSALLNRSTNKARMGLSE